MNPKSQSYRVAYLAALMLAMCVLATVAEAQSVRKIRQKPINRAEIAEKAASEGDLLRAEWKDESLRKAITKYKEALRHYELTNDSQHKADILKRLGDVQFILSSYDEALRSYNRALQLTKHLGDSHLEIDLLNRLSRAYLEMADIGRATPQCRRAQELSIDMGYQRGTAEAFNCLGLISSISGDVLQAQDDYNHALDIWQQVNYDDGLAHTLLSLGYLHGNIGNTQLSLDYYQRTLRLCRSINDRQKEAFTLTAIGGAYTLSGEKQQALNFHNEALKLFRAMGNLRGEAATLNGIGYVYEVLGERTNALRHYLMALQRYQAISNRNSAATTLGYIGRIYFALGDKQKAYQFYNQKLTSSRALQDRRMEAYTLKDIGDVLGSANPNALQYYQQALVLSKSVMDRRGQAHILKSMGDVFEELGQRTQAIGYYQQALSLMQAVTDRRGEVLTLYSLARTERNLGQLAEARSHIEKSLELIESLRIKVFSPSLRISYVTTVYQHYEFYIDLLMRMHRQNPGSGYNHLALEVNEHARAKTLLENLSAARLDIRRGVDPELLNQENQLRQRLNQKTEQQIRLLSGRGNSPQAGAFQNEIESLLAQLEEVKSAIREKSPAYAALTQPPELRLAELQKELGPDSLLIEYSLGSERSYGWALTDTSLTSFELPEKARIEAVARQLYKGLASSKEDAVQRRSPYSEVAAKLSGMLLDPIRPLLGRRRLVIVADGVLQYIPFSALPEPGQTKGNPVATEPLVVNHEIVNLPSLSTLAVLRDEVGHRAKAPKALAVFADPVFERDDPRVYLARARSKPARYEAERGGDMQDQQLDKETEEFGGDEQPVKFQRLPFTLQEAQAIFKVVPDAETKRAIGFDANLSAVLDPELRQYRIIHFATHGLLNNSHPELSGIVLSLVDRAGRQRDGFLRLNEIYNLDLPAELVVLSACQTGLGKEARGEGLIGLTRGFMYSGVPRVVASLWRVDDRAAAEFMTSFYEAMFTQHLTPAAALRAAQIKMWQTSNRQFPHYWAAFVLHGEWN